jgi:hypothetical protein
MTVTDNEGLHVSFAFPEDFQKQIKAKKHWIIIFSRTGLGMIDEVDVAIGDEPTYPTLMTGTFPCTVIPKAKVSRERLQTAMQKATRSEIEIPEGQDILALTSARKEAIAMLQWLDYVANGGNL